MQSFTTFNGIHNDTDLFVIHTTLYGQFVLKSKDLEIEEYTTFATLQGVKNATVFVVLINLESGLIVVWCKWKKHLCCS